jgi:hypothetical protein
MSQYYLSAEINGERVRIILDSTSKVAETQSGTLNKFIFENGDQGSDNYVNNTNKISFSGIISDIKSLSSVLTSESINAEDGSLDEAGKRNVNQVGIFDNEKVYLRAAKSKSTLEKIKSNKIPVLVKVPNREVYNNCYITTVAFIQTSRNGVTAPTSATGREFSSEELTSSYQVDITFEQVRLGARAEETVVRDDELVAKYWDEQLKQASKKDPSKIRVTTANEKAEATGAGGRRRGQFSSINNI